MQCSPRLAGHRSLGLSAIVLASLASLASAQLEVKAVPWQGDPSFAHQVYSGASLMLQGVAVTAPGCTLVSATWDPGDGSAPVSVSVANPRALELAHTYTGLNQQPFVATLTVTDSCANQVSDQFRVVVLTRTLDVDVNMAIDRGLWNLHKRLVLSSVSGVPTGYWPSASQYEQNIAAATSSGIQAMAVHGHKPNGNGAQDPYVDDVVRALAHVFTELSPVNIAAQPAGNPDHNGNGIGLQVSSNPNYVGGQVIDALVASGTPNALAPTGNATWVLGRSYKDIVQDMIEMYAWGQSENGSARGGWRYSWNADSDNSAAQWMAIGGIAAERSPLFQSTIPAFVKSENLSYWLTYSQYLDNTNPYTGYDGSLGYGGPVSFAWDSGMNTTPSGLVQFVMDSVPSSDPRFQRANGYVARNWSILLNANRIYGMFATAKAMRLAVPPVTHLTSGSISIDWYRNDTQAGDTIDGLARELVSSQQADGSWDEALVRDDLATAWALVILSSTIVELGPIAVCDVEPENTAAGFPVTLDGTNSYHLDPARTITTWEWDFEGDGTFDAVGPMVVHSYANTGTYSVVLRVTDDTTPSNLQATSSCIVQITPPPNPPNADPGGPYDFCPGNTWTLDGSASSDPDGSLVSYEWDYVQPLNLDFLDGTGVSLDVTGYFSGLPVGVYNVALRVTDNNTLQNTDFGTVYVRAAGDPACASGGPNLVCPADVLEVWNGGPPAQIDPQHTGTATWSDSCPGVAVWYGDHYEPGLYPGEPELIVRRTWHLTDSCGVHLECEQTITLLSPSAAGGMFLDVRPGNCPNSVAIWNAGNTLFAVAGNAQIPAAMIDMHSLRIERVQGGGARLKPNYCGLQDAATPYHGSWGNCTSAGPDGVADVVFELPNSWVRRGLGLASLPHGTQVEVKVTGLLTDGTPFEARDRLVVSQVNHP